MAILALIIALAPCPSLAAGDLRVLARARTIAPEVLTKFERETGIRAIGEEVGDSGEMVARLKGGQSGFDIAFPPDHHVADLIEAGLLERVWADRLPGFWNIEDPWRSRSFDPRNEYTIPNQWGTTSFAVDTSIHKGDIDTLRLLFDPPPEVAGRVGILDGADIVQLALLYLGEARCTPDTGRLDKALKEVHPLLARARLVRPADMVQSLGGGDLALAVVRSGDAMRARDSRPSLAYAYPREGNLVWTDVIAVPRNPPNRANALKFLTFMLKPENAALQSNFNRSANMIRGSEAHMLAPVLAAPELVAPWPAKVGFLVSCGAKVQRRHEEVWEQAKRQALKSSVSPEDAAASRPAP
ncbi:spermidine/putrescine ABC transporter substrate-binding protein [Paramagnetospirillum marisnigri]|uniref:Spermidine/putrescine ABC transporter substrate-binding protein n=1 Tax=Paramagnetospirillum marisnigri TaxID=1285242 RepID=A0A178MHQ7_9PROT|nr:extracellular solute-binding protein [Paramagnetospirillum marisnigri]OAN48170.1 spermidine/putrescine ABC transporter substrate-binding protein [Paramagnetospirillum marisnigri]